MPVAAHYRPDPHHTELGEGFFDAVQPAQFPKHILRFRNQIWAERVGLGSLSDIEWISHFGRFEPLPGNLQQALSLRYHGHQFRVYNPDLGDGRGFLFAQFRDPDDSRLLDLGTKGSGQTPWSRSGDGRLTLKGSVREVLATEMLESLGVYTSKTFSVIETGESLIRHDEPSPTRAAVLVRLSHGHVRFGTFQRFAYLKDTGKIQALLDYSIRYYYPTLEAVAPVGRPAAFLKAVVEATARLCASWMIAGFVHGVLNTDNMNITGESFDYGPYRFLPTYDPAFTAAYFDHSGLYAFGRQPESVVWNLEQLANCLAALDERTDPLVDSLNSFGPAFNDALIERFLDRIGLKSAGAEQDMELISATFTFLSESGVGYDQFYHDWYGGLVSQSRAEAGPVADQYRGSTFEEMSRCFRRHEAIHSEYLQHPYFQEKRPCSLLIDEIEWIWEAIAQTDDWSRFEKKIHDIRRMGQAYGRRKDQNI